MGGWKLSWALVNLTLENLEKAQEDRPLTQEELEFKRYLKAKAMGLAVVQRARARQHARLSWMRKGDTNTRFFQLHVNMMKKKLFIASLVGENGGRLTRKQIRAGLKSFLQLIGQTE